jgi:hypothetical protein
MVVNKYTLKNNLSGDTSFSINIPIGTNNGMLGQQELVTRDFINIEVERAVNIIFDYEKVKFLPIKDNKLINNITYNLNFLKDSSSYNTKTSWADIEFVDEDLKLKKNSFIKSFLRLDFYDTDIATNQNLISFITLFPKFSYDDVRLGRIPSASNYYTTFKLGNPLIKRTENGEGFSLFHFKDEVIPTVPKYLYMKATFNNSKSGKSLGFMSTDNPNLEIDKLNKTTIKLPSHNLIDPNVKNNLYTRYILKRDIDGYFYEIDTTYSNNVSYTNNQNINSYEVNLYQISSK